MERESTSRRRTHRRRKAQPSAAGTRRPDYTHLHHPFAPAAVFDPDAVARLHDAALQILEDFGIRVLLPEARNIFVQAGARIDDDMVRIGRDIVAAALASAPRRITIRAANAERNQIYEAGALLFAPGGGCPNASDADRGRRPGTLRDLRETLKLVQSFDVLHVLGPTVEPQDVPAPLRHYAQIRAQLTLADKPLSIFARGRAQVAECLEMVQIGLDLSDEAFAGAAWATSVINSNSPRVLDAPMAEGLIDFARAGQLAIMTPFCLAGAMAPVTVAGALALQHAECLAGITLSQLARPGAPVSYGGFASNVDMRSGAPAFGTPEHVKMQIGSGQLARHVGLPWRAGVGAASNAPDMQSATETGMGLWGALMGNATLTLHAAGWLEGGLTFSYEKFVNDIEALQMIAELGTPTHAGTDEIALDAIGGVVPSGHFFDAPHTMARYQQAFYQPLLADLRSHGAWTEAGGRGSADRATDVWKARLADFEPPIGAAAADARLAPYIEARTRAGGAPPAD